MTTFKIGNTYELANVYNVVQSLEDDYDYASLVLPFSNRKARYEPFTLVEIEHDTITEYWWLNSDTTKAVDMSERTKHRHEITLIELTKILERYPMPNRSFTKVGQTALEITQNIIDTVPFDDTFNYVDTRVIDSIASEVSIALDDVVIDDLFLNERTLLEAFVEIFKLIKAFPRLTYDGINWILSADFYNDLADLEDKEDNIANRLEVQDISKYATSFVISGSNQIDNDVFITEPTPTGWLGLRGDGGFLDIEKSFIQLQQKIELIEQVTIEFNYGYSGTGYTETITADITDYVVSAEEKKALDTSEVDYVLGNGIPEVYQGIFQDNTLFYNIGGDRIDGIWEQYQPGIFGSDTTSAIYLLCRTVIYRDTAQNPEGVYPDLTPETFKFRVKYLPVINARQKVEREDLSEFTRESTLIQGQSERYLSSKKMLADAYSRLNRTGSTEIKTTQHNLALSDVYPVGTYTSDGYILTEVERLMYPNHFNATYKWTKDFQKVSEMLGLNSQPKLFEIETTQVRNEIFAQYIVMDIFPATNNSYITDDAFSTFINTLRPTPLSAFNAPIIGAVFQSADMTETGVLRAVTPYGGANILNFHFAFTSPLSAGARVIDATSHKQNEIVKYTNADYELEDFNCYYISDTTVDSANLPIVATPTSYLIDARGFKCKKDKSDVLALTYQIIVTAQQGLDFFAGKKLIEQNNLLKTIDTYDSLIVYVSDIPYNANDLEFVHGVEDVGNTYTYDADNRYIEIVNSTTRKSWALGDADRNLYLAVNQQLDENGAIIDTRRVYFNRRNDRTDSTYQAPIPKPINLETTAGSTAIFFDWDDADLSDSFVAECIKVSTGEVIEIAATTDTFYNFENLVVDTEYQLRVKAVVGIQESAYASVTDTTTLGAPAMPSWIDTTVISTTQIDIEWEDVLDEEYYQIAWSTDLSTWQDTQTKAAGQTTHSYTGLTAGTGYYFRVRAGSETYGDSEWYIDEVDGTPVQTFTESGTQTTANPSILSVNWYSDRVEFTVKNNDDDTASVSYGIGAVGSTSVSLASGETSSTITLYPSSTQFCADAYVRANAQASGEYTSGTVSSSTSGYFYPDNAADCEVVSFVETDTHTFTVNYWDGEIAGNIISSYTLQLQQSDTGIGGWSNSGSSVSKSKYSTSHAFGMSGKEVGFYRVRVTANNCTGSTDRYSSSLYYDGGIE